MARTRIIIGHTGEGPRVIYVGSSGSESQSAMQADTSAASFEIFEGPGRRKNNPRYIPPVAMASDPPEKLPSKAKASTRS